MFICLSIRLLYECRLSLVSKTSTTESLLLVHLDLTHRAKQAICDFRYYSRLDYSGRGRSVHTKMFVNYVTIAIDMRVWKP